MNIDLSCCPKPLPLASPLSLAAPLELAKTSVEATPKSPIDLGPVFDGGQLPGGCFACGLAFSSTFGEQFLGQFFGL